MPTGSALNSLMLIDAADRNLQKKYASIGWYRVTRHVIELPCEHGVDRRIGWRGVVSGMRRTTLMEESSRLECNDMPGCLTIDLKMKPSHRKKPD